MLERRRNYVRYLTLLSNVRLLFSIVRYLTSFRCLSDVYKIPPIAFFEISGFGPVWIRLKLRASGQVGIYLLWVPN